MNQPFDPNNSSNPSVFDPQLHRETQNAVEEYRKAVKEEISKGYESRERNISRTRCDILEERANELKIPKDKADIIKDEELKPYQDIQKNFQKFKLRLREVYKDDIDNISDKKRHELKELKEALKLPDQALALAHLSLGQDLRKEDKLEQALKQVKEAIRIGDQLPEAFIEKGAILQQQGMKLTNILQISQKRSLIKEAIESYEKAQKICEQVDKKEQSNKIKLLIKEIKKIYNDNLLINFVQMLLEMLFVPKLTKNSLEFSSQKDIQEVINRNSDEILSKDKELKKAREEKMMAERPNINNYDLTNAKIGALATTGGYASGVFYDQSANIDYSSKQNLAEVAVEIQQSIAQLQSHGDSLEVAREKIAKDLAKQAQINPILKERLIRWRDSLDYAATNALLGEETVEVFKLFLKLVDKLVN
ncbi:hypothetical protein [Floridanema aerugineum]|uniref:Uncharacterized protein n=1 Tax=Floridaenema aerugineum BLCC-F46 TaxID=3153654 RepID=A0ABV4X248_9CYAN